MHHDASLQAATQQDVEQNHSMIVVGRQTNNWPSVRPGNRS